jgi:hypothetical protein
MEDCRILISGIVERLVDETRVPGLPTISMIYHLPITVELFSKALLPTLKLWQPMSVSVPKSLY